MNRRSILIKLSIAVLVTLIASGAIWQLRRVSATTPPEPDRFGMIGLTRGQTMRLNVVNLAPQELAPPCRVVLSFRDPTGRPLTNTDGQVIRREVSLQSGESAFLDLNGEMFGPPTTNDATGPARIQLRPIVRVLASPREPDRNIPPPCFPTLEVFDTATGRTSIFATGFALPPDPDRQ